MLALQNSFHYVAFGDGSNTLINLLQTDAQVVFLVFSQILRFVQLNEINTSIFDLPEDVQQLNTEASIREQTYWDTDPKASPQFYCCDRGGRGDLSHHRRRRTARTR